MKLTTEQLEYAISRSIDGTLPAIEQAALDERLATDLEARGLLEEYRQLDSVMRASVGSVPNLQWDKLTSRLSAGLAGADAPVGRFALPWVRTVQRVAVAASVLLVVGLGIASYRDSGNTSPRETRLAVATPIQVTIGTGAPAEPRRFMVMEVAIGPGSDAADDAWRYADAGGIISRPAVVLIDRAYGPGQDIDSMPY